VDHVSVVLLDVETLFRTFWASSTIPSGAKEPQSCCDAQAKVKGLPLPCLSANRAERLELPTRTPRLLWGQIIPARYLHGSISHPESLWRTGRNGDTSALLQTAGSELSVPRHGVGTCLLARLVVGCSKSTLHDDRARCIPLLRLANGLHSGPSSCCVRRAQVYISGFFSS
jgi:hypothetical protein